MPTTEDATPRAWLDRIRRIPAILVGILWTSVLSGLVIAWLWFATSDHVWIRWLALPWLAVTAVPQLGLWILASSVRDLVDLPRRLMTVKSGLSEGGAQVLEKIRSKEAEDREPRGFLATLRDAYALHGEIAKLVATRAILHRFTGLVAVFIGPVSFIANCLIIALALLSIALAG